MEYAGTNATLWVYLTGELGRTSSLSVDGRTNLQRGQKSNQHYFLYEWDVGQIKCVSLQLDDRDWSESYWSPSEIRVNAGKPNEKVFRMDKYSLVYKQKVNLCTGN